ncbi:MAG: hypothetical protein RSC31_07565 [Anaerovoracaceae bacterium]
MSQSKENKIGNTGREALHRLLDLAIDIQARGDGEIGYPYIGVNLSNYGTDITVRVNDCGFRSRQGYDGSYDLAFNNVLGRTYNNCMKHLEELKAKIETEE